MSTALLNRRTFLKSSALAAAGVALSARSHVRAAGANGDIRVAVVGLNGKGRDHVRSLSALPGVRVVALCDADTAVLERALRMLREAGGEAETFVDVRDLLARSDIDAITIATPNHLHSLLAIWACQAGKDVYVEKPVSHNLWEGRQLVAAAEKYGRIVQAGMQCRSSHGLGEAVAWVQAGNLGRVTAARGLCYKRRDSVGDTDGPQPVPSTVNYDLWLGPAQKQPPHRRRFHYDWHWFWEFGNGDLGNQGVHQVDIARWFLGEAGIAPRVLSVGGRLGYKDDAETPNTQIIIQDYARAPLIFEVRGLPSAPDPASAQTVADADSAAGFRRSGGSPMDKYRGASIGVVIHCEGGHVLVPSYTTAQAFDRDGRLLKEWSGATSHYQNFIDCMRSRRTADQRGPIPEGHVSSALCHTASISHLLGRTVGAEELREQIKGNAAAAEAFGRMAEHLSVHGIDVGKPAITLGLPLAFDPAAEQFTGEGSRRANALLTRDYRAPFVVPNLSGAKET